MAKLVDEISESILGGALSIKISPRLLDASRIAEVIYIPLLRMPNMAMLS